MLTVGGIVVSWRQVEQIETALHINAAALFAGEAMLTDVVDLVPITLKEKLALDRLLPCGPAIDFSQAAADAGIRVGAGEVVKYKRLYNHFPLFTEVAT
jgi:hypothetical protein